RVMMKYCTVLDVACGAVLMYWNISKEGRFEIPPRRYSLVLSDVLDAGLTFGGVESATGFSCSGSLECTLPAGTLPGTYTVVYTATVDADATGALGNHVTATGGGGTTGPDCSACSTEHVV